MLRSQLKHSFTPLQIEHLLAALGSDPPHITPSGDFIFQTICHNPAHQGSYKLYYYVESQLFHCFTDCSDSFDVYELVQRVLRCSFPSAVAYVQQTLHLVEDRQVGFSPQVETDDWDILNRYASFSSLERHSEPPDYTPLPNSLLEFYPRCSPLEWRTEGITPEVAAKYQIRFDVASNAIIIPHFDRYGNLIGIRSRSLNEEVVASGFKYMPTQLEGKDFRHTLRYNLYGLYQNEESIKRIQKVLIVEAEKSVLQCAGFYGDNNFTLAVCGSNISTFQRDTILKLGVKEVFLGFDKEFHEAYSEESDAYSEKVLRLASMFTPYVRTCVLWDKDGLLGYKDSPTDRGQQVLESLMNSKYEVHTKEN